MSSNSGTPIRIAPIGDSITAQARGYRPHLHAKLVAAGFSPSWLGVADTTLSELPGVVLRHTGIGGARIDEIDSSLSEARLGIIDSSDATSDAPGKFHRAPDYVLWLGGTNDLGQLGSAPLPLASAPARSLAFIDRLHRRWPTTAIIVGLVPELAGRARERAAFNAALATGAWARRVARTTIAKTAEAYSLKQTLDGTHPDGDGANLLARAWFSAIAWTRPSHVLGAYAAAGAIVLAGATAGVLLSR